jgi:hypothetical protein
VIGGGILAVAGVGAARHNDDRHVVVAVRRVPSHSHGYYGGQGTCVYMCRVVDVVNS